MMESNIPSGRHLAEHANLAGSKFLDVNLVEAEFNNVNMSKVVFNDINLSDISISAAQIGGARFKHIGLPKGAPGTQRPVQFEECDLNDSLFIRCNLTGVEIEDCDLDGMKINGILVKDLLVSYGEGED